MPSRLDTSCQTVTSETHGNVQCGSILIPSPNKGYTLPSIFVSDKYAYNSKLLFLTKHCNSRRRGRRGCPFLCASVCAYSVWVCEGVSNTGALQYHQGPACSFNTHLSLSEDRIMQKWKTQKHNTVSVLGYPIISLGVLVYLFDNDYQLYQCKEEFRYTIVWSLLLWVYFYNVQRRTFEACYF